MAFSDGPFRPKTNAGPYGLSPNGIFDAAEYGANWMNVVERGACRQYRGEWRVQRGESMKLIRAAVSWLQAPGQALNQVLNYASGASTLGEDLARRSRKRRHNAPRSRHLFSRASYHCRGSICKHVSVSDGYIVMPDARKHASAAY